MRLYKKSQCDIIKIAGEGYYKLNFKNFFKYFYPGFKKQLATGRGGEGGKRKKMFLTSLLPYA